MDRRPKREVTFQEGGERRALEVIRRHRLAERLLSEVFELEETDFETSACQFEHILSPQVLESVCTFLGHPPCALMVKRFLPVPVAPDSNGKWNPWCGPFLI